MNNRNEHANSATTPSPGLQALEPRQLLAANLSVVGPLIDEVNVLDEIIDNTQTVNDFELTITPGNTVTVEGIIQNIDVAPFLRPNIGVLLDTDNDFTNNDPTTDPLVLLGIFNIGDNDTTVPGTDDPTDPGDLTFSVEVVIPPDTPIVLDDLTTALVDETVTYFLHVIADYGGGDNTAANIATVELGDLSSTDVNIIGSDISILGDFATTPAVAGEDVTLEFTIRNTSTLVIPQPTFPFTVEFYLSKFQREDNRLVDDIANGDFLLGTAEISSGMSPNSSLTRELTITLPDLDDPWWDENRVTGTPNTQYHIGMIIDRPSDNRSEAGANRDFPRIEDNSNIWFFGSQDFGGVIAIDNLDGTFSYEDRLTGDPRTLRDFIISPFGFSFNSERPASGALTEDYAGIATGTFPLPVVEDSFNTFDVVPIDIDVLPDLLVADLALTGSGPFRPGETVTVTGTVVNKSKAPSRTVPLDLYLSRDGDIDSQIDFFLDQVATGPIDGADISTGTPFEQTFRVQVRLPGANDDFWQDNATDSSQFFIGSIVNPPLSFNPIQLTEDDGVYGDNANIGIDFDVAAATIDLSTVPNIDPPTDLPATDVDLVPVAFNLTQTSVKVNETLDISFQVMNAGTEDAAATTVSVYASLDSTINPNADQFLGSYPVEALIAGATSSLIQIPASARVKAPHPGSGIFSGDTKPTSLFFGIYVDGDREIFEADEDNNVSSTTGVGLDSAGITGIRKVRDKAGNRSDNATRIDNIAKRTKTRRDFVGETDTADWWTFDLDSRSKIVIRSNSKRDNLALTLYDRALTQLFFVDSPGRKNERIEETLPSGKYFVRINQSGINNNSGYKLNITVTPAASAQAVAGATTPSGFTFEDTEDTLADLLATSLAAV